MADISLGPTENEPEAIPDRYWIAEFPEAIYQSEKAVLRLAMNVACLLRCPALGGLVDRPEVSRR